MKFVLSIFSLVTLCLSASANQPVVSFMDTLNSTPSIEDFRGSNADVCADFSGNWKGVCLASGTKKDESMTIKQNGCVAVEVSNGKHTAMLAIGGVVGMSGALPGTPAVTFGGHIQSHWNADKTVLHVSAMGGGKKLDLTSAPKGGMYSNKVFLKDGKLYTDIFTMGHGTKIAFCEFTKQ